MSLKSTLPTAGFGMIGLVILSAALYLFGNFRAPLLVAGFLAQSAYIASRGIEVGRLPLVGPHDTLFFLSASVILFGLPFGLRLNERKRFFASVTGLAVFFMCLSLFFKPHAFPLPPVLKTLWFETHVAFSFFSYALFGIGAVLGALFLVRPDVVLERLQYKAVLMGYFLFSLAMVLGGIWAYLAWGTYWLWTPKELWTVILWLFYSLYLHARLRRAWSGRPSVILGVAGFGVVMFTYLGVSLLMKSSHSF